MKKRAAALAAAMCILLTGCAESSRKKPIKVNYSGMFKPNAAAPAAESSAANDGDDSAEENAITQNAHANAASPKSEPNASSAKQEGSSGKSVEKYANGAKQQAGSANVGTQSGAQNNASGNAQSNAKSTAPAIAPAPSPAPKASAPQPQANAAKAAESSGIQSRSGVYNSASDVASIPLGDVCYIPYKVVMPETPAKPADPDNSSDQDEPKNVKIPTKYDYGYRVIFRTPTDTYLLAMSPYKQCHWNEITDVLTELENEFEPTVTMVGAPSVNDLRDIAESGVYLTNKFDMWTSTPVTEGSAKAYYCNSKGAYYATQGVSRNCGLCAIIKVSTSQNNAELLSTAYEGYNDFKARLEAEETQYTQAKQNKQNSAAG